MHSALRILVLCATNNKRKEAVTVIWAMVSGQSLPEQRQMHWQALGGRREGPLCLVLSCPDPGGALRL